MKLNETHCLAVVMALEGYKDVHDGNVIEDSKKQLKAAIDANDPVKINELSRELTLGLQDAKSVNVALSFFRRQPQEITIHTDAQVDHCLQSALEVLIDQLKERAMEPFFELRNNQTEIMINNQAAFEAAMKKCRDEIDLIDAAAEVLGFITARIER